MAQKTVASLCVLWLTLASTLAELKDSELEIKTIKNKGTCLTKISNGDFISVHYTAKVRDGEEFYNTKSTKAGDGILAAAGDPQSFVFGAKESPEIFNKGLVDMCLWQMRRLTFPGDAIPNIDADKKHEMLIYTVELVAVTPAAQYKRELSLFSACKSDKVKKMLPVLDRVDVNMRNANGRTPLLVATFYGSYRATQLLLDSKADPNIGMATSGLTPLIQAAGRGYMRIVQALVAAGATPDAVISTGHFAGYNAVHFAAMYGYPDVVVYLLQRGADGYREAADGVTPLGAARALVYETTEARVNKLDLDRMKKELPRLEGVFQTHSEL